ncbi:Microtubule-actin cross-linking factor 1-like protein [Sarcoptes scabiei]|uniref:Microtubule-actin cross-linking factor 1-like protein n=1 Tax=Sarcoptes scabiei TaxID=52283 RepID=A0A132AIA4_SARSC|nr:Microtubule-actin cross-linking factor 1-like protein [Sarcoptes scabiei]
MDYYDCYYDNIDLEQAQKEYESSVFKYKDERDAIQKKTFTKWVNKHLIKYHRPPIHHRVTKGVVDLFEDLRDGNNLISLLEILSGETLPREKGKLRVHHLQNIQTCLKFLKNRNIKLVNIRPDDIVDGNPKLTLGLIWTIILHFQLSDIILYDDTISFKEALLKWARKTTEGYPDVNVRDFTHSWKDGKAFNAIIHRNRPDLLDYRSCRSRTAIQNLEHAFNVAERDLGVTKLLDPEDVYCPNPDEKSLITYISSLYELFPEPPENNPLLDKERLKRIEEYKKSARKLVEWIDESCRRLSDRNFSPSIEEMKNLQNEMIRFRNEEMPPKFTEKQRIVSNYKQIFEMALQLPIRIDEELKPESIENKWKELMLTYQERDRDIKDYMARLQDLEAVAENLRKNIRECDRKLTEIEYKIIEEQKKIQKSTTEPDTHAIEQINKELCFEEKRINKMMKDANYLIDQHYPTARDLYDQVKHLHERYCKLRIEFDEKIYGALEDKSIQKVHQAFCDLISVLLEKLKEQERIIVKKLQEPIPRKLDDIQDLMAEHKRFEIDTRRYEPDIERVRKQFEQLPTRNAASQSKFDTLMDTWNKIWTYSDNYRKQLDALQIILMDINDANRLINDLETVLSKSPDMAADVEQVRHIFDQLKNIHSKVLKHNSSFEKLISNVSKIRKVVELSRPQKTTIHPDVDRLEEDCKQLHKRWDDINTQVLERIKSMEICLEILQSYRNRMLKEIDWMRKMNQAVEDFVRQKELRSTKQLYEEASSHKSSIDETNNLGQRFIKEAKIYDQKLKNYREHLEEYHQKRDSNDSSQTISLTNQCELNAQFNKYHQTITTATVSNVPVSEKHDCRNLSISTLNVTQDIRSREEKNFTEITVNRVFETDNELADKFMGWLDQKERVIAKLEPICSEPQKLVSQLHEAQQLGEEFASQEPTLKKIDRMADSLLEQLERTSNKFAVIQEKQERIHEKWNKLLGIIKSREQNLRAVKDAASDFQNKFDRVLSALHKISDDFNNICDSKAENDEKLLKLSHLEESLENQRPNLADCDRACAKLCELLTDSGSKNEVKNKVGGLRKFYDELSQKINDKKAELQSSLKADKDFFFNCEAIQEWLRNMQNRLSKDFKVSAIHEKLVKQVEKFEPIHREVLDKEHEIHILIQKGEQLQQNLSRSSDAGPIRQKIDSIRKQYQQLKEEATVKHTKLQKCLDISSKYRQALESFLPWLDQTEDRVRSLSEITLTKQDVEKVLRETQSIKNDISRHASEFEKICSLGESLISNADIDTEVIREQLTDLKRRWNDLQREIDTKIRDLDKLLQKLSTYDDKARDLNQGLNQMDDKLRQLNDKDPKQLEKLEAMLDDSKKLADDLDDLKKVGFNIIDEAGPDADSKPIEDDLKNFSDRYDTLSNNLADRHKNLSKASGAMQKFQSDLSALQRELNLLEERLDKMSPIGRKIQIVQMQIEEMNEFFAKLNKVHSELKEAERKAEDLISRGFATDAKGTRNQIENLNRKYDNINERGQMRMKNLKEVLDKLKNFDDSLNQNMRNIKELLDEIDHFKPISRDVEMIRSQQRELQTFVQRNVEPLKKKVDDTNKLGNELIQTASHGVDVGPLEKDLERQNDSWNNLKAKVSEREKNLEAAFLQAGRFEDALKNVEKWLKETEDMVARQKPPSSDIVALKAQLQEQKYLKKSLTDRQESIDNLKELGNELMKNLDRNERMQIEKQLSNVNERFDKLMKNCDDRLKNLEDILPLAKEFSEKIVALQEWLESSARKLNSLQAFSIEPNKLNRRVTEHQSFHQEIVGRQKDFKNLSNLGQRLMELIRDEQEGRLIANKLSQVIEKYSKLVEDSDDLRKRLNNAADQIGKFMNDFDKISKWIDEIESRMQKHKVLSVNYDKLREQHDDVQNIQRQIDAYKPDVDDLIQRGQNLAREFSSNDSIFVRQKVEIIQNKFNDLKQMVGDKLDHIRASMNLLQKFYTAHDQLNEWMDQAENKLSKLDSLSISQQNDIIDKLLDDVPSKRRLLDSVNNLGTEVARNISGQGAATINNLVSKCNKRFDSIVEQLQRRSEKIKLIKKQNEELRIDTDQLYEWFKNAERQLLNAEPITSNYDQLLVLLREVKQLNDEINSQKLRVRELVNKVKKLMRDSMNDELIVINNKVDELKELANHVSQLCQDRLNSIEHALPLVEHFFDTHNEITQFLDDVENEVQLLAQPSIHPEQIRKQQETTKRLIQALKSNKPLFDRLNKTGEELISLLQRKSDIDHIQKIMDSDNERYNRLKNALRERQNDLEDALQATALFADKLDGMLNALSSTHDQLKNAEPISAHVEKIKEQIGDNNAILDDLKKREDAFNAVKNHAKEIISKAGRSDEPTIRDIKNKLDRLDNLWDEIHKMAYDRRDCLDEALKMAKIFWKELGDVMRKIKELENSLESQEPPAVEPEKIQRQQDILSGIKNEMDQTRPRIEQCKQSGKTLMKLCGEPDRPEVRKHLEDLDSAWDNVTSLYAKREKNLIDAMDKAMNFHEKMRNLLDFLDKAEDKFSRLGPIGADIDEVKRQINELKNFKNFVDPHMVDVEALNRMAHELLDRVPSHQAKGVRDAVANINRRWNDLLKNIGDRQSDLDKALLKLGQFQHSLNELLAWIEKMTKMLDESGIIYGDPQVIEVELAKHKVLLNDINAQQANVDSLNNVGKQLIDSETGTENARNTRAKLDDLNRRWSDLINKANNRTKDLEDSLQNSQRLAQEIQDMLAWLNEMDQLISSSKAVGGLPETAREQLNRFMEIYNELVMNRHNVETLLQNGEEYVSKAREGQAVHLQNNLKNLANKWENILNRANDRKIKLEIALKEALEFHEALQEFVDWLTSAEKYLASLQPVSRVLDHVLKQIEEHKQFQKDIGQHRETMLNLDKKGSHLKYFSQKQDVILIKNLLSSVQMRWEKVLTKTAERARSLDHGFKEAKEFHDAWSDLITWLEDAESTLDAIEPMGNNPDLIKQTLYRHKEFQRQLGAKQSSYDSTMRFGKSLKDKAPKEDGPILQEMLDELKNKWNRVCNKAVEKQRRLEEALLFSGQFKDAIQALIEWLEKAKKILAFDQPVHGDLDTVNSLIEDHKNFIEDFKSREKNMQFVRKTAADLMKSANPEDARQIGRQMETLEEKWQEIERMMGQKQLRLDDALKQANQLHKSVQTLLEWLSDAERKLRFAGPLPEDEHAIQAQMHEHQNLIREMQTKERDRNSTLELAKDILQKCHPNAMPVIKHWITIIQSRWDEVESWGRQREKKLNDHLKSLKDASQLLDELQTWLMKTEKELQEQESIPLPEDMLELEKMNDNHQRLIDDLNDKKADVEFVIKTYSSKKSAQPKDRSSSRRYPSASKSILKSQFDQSEINNPKVNDLIDKWHSVWRLASDRMKHLKDGLNYSKEFEKKRSHQREYSSPTSSKNLIIFGDSQKLRLVRILRSTVMVRVGGGWVSLDDFLVKNDPCRGMVSMINTINNRLINDLENPFYFARGRTNVELKEQFVLADGVSQSMAPFKSKSPFQADGSINLIGPISKKVHLTSTPSNTFDCK